MSDDYPNTPPEGGRPPHGPNRLETWPEPAPRPPRVVVGTGAARAIVAAGVAAGALLVGHPAGLGLVVLAFALGVAAARAPRGVIPTADLRARPDAGTRAWWVLAGALACVPLLRAATWVIVPSLLASLALAALAVAGGRRPGQLLAALGALPTRVPSGSAATASAATRGLRVRGAGAAARGAVLAALVLAIFVPLLVSADAAFAQLLDDVLPSGWSVDRPGARIGVWLLATLAGAALAHLALRPPNPQPRPAKRQLTKVEYALPLGALVLLLAGFVGIQITTLFGGDRHVLQTAGLSYADYAHHGFVQLLAVAALTLAVVAAARRWADGGTWLLAALCVLTLVVLASALKRLNLYEQAYGYTRLRLAADAALYYLGALFILVLVAQKRAWLPRAIVATTAVAVLVFALSDPDRRIAERNVAAGRIDRVYLASLSPDAAPALVKLDRAPCARLGHDGLIGFNFGRHRARVACR